MAKNSGWVPQQHGAWAMLAVPTVLGLVLAGDRAGVLAAAAVAVTFWAGYFLFSAASLWLKAPARRRHTLTRPLLTYGAVTAALGTLALIVNGSRLLWWLPVFLPLLGGTLWLVHTGRERSLLSGGLTVAAASLLPVVMTGQSPLVRRTLGEADATAWLLALACFGYFFGTVWSVKTMIRQRGSLPWWSGAVAHHVVATLVAIVVAVRLPVTWGWVWFFAATVVRTVVMPMIGPLARPPRVVRPRTLGLVEIVFSIALLALGIHLTVTR